MIGKTALALAAAIIIASAAALMVGAAAFALFFALESLLTPAGAAAGVAGILALFLLVVLFIANLRQPKAEHHHAPPAPQLHSMISSFSDTFKDRPLLTLGLAALTGLAATRDPNLLKDLWAAVLHPRDDRA